MGGRGGHKRVSMREEKERTNEFLDEEMDVKLLPEGAHAWSMYNILKYNAEGVVWNGKKEGRGQYRGIAHKKSSFHDLSHSALAIVE